MNEPQAGERYADIMKSEGFVCAEGNGYRVFVKGDITVLAGASGDKFRVVISSEQTGVYEYFINN